MIHYPPSGCTRTDVDGPDDKDDLDPTAATCPTCIALIAEAKLAQAKAAAPADLTLEWIEQTLGTGDDATTLFGGNAKAQPIVTGTLTITPPPHDVVSDPHTGVLQAIYNADGAPKRNVPVTARYAWRPPRLRGAKLVAMFPDGRQEQVTIEEIADAIRRSGMG